MALKDFAEGRTDQYKVDPRKLQIKQGWNSRDFSDPANLAHIEELSKSIAEVGVKRALVVNVENDIPYVVDGECRYRAVMLAIERGADIKTVPVVGEDRFANEGDRLFNQFLYNSGKPFGPIENARHFKRLLDLGWKQQDIATKSGMSGGRVSQLLELLTLPLALQQFIVEGKASASMVLAIFKKHNEDAALALAELTGAVQVAQEQGRKRAMPKDTGDGEGGSGNAKKGAGKPSLKSHLKAMIEKAYTDSRIDDTENMVTMSISEGDWAELMEMINY